MQGWPELFIYTLYDRILDDIPAKDNIYTTFVDDINTARDAKEGTHMQGWPEQFIYTLYDRMFNDFPAKDTVYTPYMYGFGQPYTHTHTHTHAHTHVGGLTHSLRLAR